jgi:hypothetical protein
MTFLLLHWRWILIAALAASTALFFTLWRVAVEDLTVFKAQVAIIGQAAEAEKKRIDEANATTLKEIKDAIPKQIADARAGAVKRYIASLPPSSGSCVLPAPTVVPGGVDATGSEQLVTCRSGFIEDAAQDAATIGLVQEWVRKVGLPIK